jgi:hypothetical protein
MSPQISRIFTDRFIICEICEIGGDGFLKPFSCVNSWLHSYELIGKTGKMMIARRSGSSFENTLY